MKRIARLLPLLALAAAPARAADPATNAPALLPEPFSALRLGMAEAAFRAARPDAKRDEDRARIWPETAHYEEKPEGGLFPFAFFALADATDGARTLEWAMFCGEPPEGEPAGASAAAALRDAESRLGPAQRRFELIRWGAVFDVRAWETDGAVAVCSTVSRTLDPDDCEENTAGNFLFGAFRRAAIERLPTPYDDLSVVVLAALARPASEDSRPFPWVDPLPGTNRIDRYELDGTPVSTREPADAVLALVSDYGSFPATVERDDFAPGKAHSGFVELGFSGRGVDIDDPKWLYLSRDCATLRVDEADYLSFSVPEDRRAALRASVAALASDTAAGDPAAAFAADRARVGAKLESIRLDAFEYAGADAVAAFTLLMDKARQADADEPEPLKRGVPMVLDVAPGDAFPAIDVSLHDVSLRDALDALSGPFGLEWMVCGSVVKAGLRGKLLRPLEYRLAKIRAEAEVPADDAGWKELLGKAGVEWPAGSYVKFLPSVRRLVLMNTEEELAKAERALADLGLAAPSPAAAESHAESAENAETGPGEAGPLPEGAAERSEAGGVSHAEAAEGAE